MFWPDRIERPGARLSLGVTAEQETSRAWQRTEHSTRSGREYRERAAPSWIIACPSQLAEVKAVGCYISCCVSREPGEQYPGYKRLGSYAAAIYQSHDGGFPGRGDKVGGIDWQLVPPIGYSKALYTHELVADGMNGIKRAGE